MLYEYRPHPRRHGPIRLLTREECAGKKGFISVCGYTEDVAKYILEQGGTYGLHRFPLYLDRAILDFDNTDAQYNAAIDKCRSEGWSYRAYHTGNRGYHLYIDMEPYHKLHAYRQLELWVSQVFKGYDPCLYKSSSITRIPGTVHHKTGKPMRLVDHKNGTKVDISKAKIDISMPPKTFVFEEQDHIYYAEMFNAMSIQYAYEGNRHAALFKLAAVGCKAGIDDDYLVEALDRWNKRRCVPALTELDINKAIRNARRKIKEG